MNDLSADEVRKLRQLLSEVERDQWSRGTLRGGLPRLPRRTALPTASADLAYVMVTLIGTPDITYQCLRSAGGVWDWRVVATG